MLTVPAGFRNYGILMLESREAGWASGLTVSEGTLTNMAGGVIDVNSGAGGPRTFSVHLLNQGAFNANDTFTLQKEGGKYENEGLIKIAAGQTLNIIQQNQTFNQSAGTLMIEGALYLNDMVFKYDGGEISGTPYLVNCDLAIGAQATNPASFLMTGGGSVLRGDVRPGQTVWSQGNSHGRHTTLTTAEGFNNRGRLQLESRDAGWASSLTVSTGSLTNTETGVIDVNPGAGGERTISADLVNRGIINLNYGSTWSKLDGVYNNEGALNIAEGQTLYITGQGQVFNQNAGSLKIDGGMQLNGIQLNYNGGAISGVPILINCEMTVGPDAIQPASFTVMGSGSVLRGDVWPGQLLWVQGNGWIGHLTLTAPAGFRNNGRLLLESRDGGYTSALAVSEGVLTNGPAGNIDFGAGWGGARVLTAHLLNQGMVLSISTADSIFNQNAGTLTIDGAFNLSQTTFNLNGGALTNAGGVDMADGTFNFNGGTATGNALYLVRCAVNIGAGATDPIGLTLTGPTTFRPAAIQEGQTVWIEGCWRGNHTTVTAPMGFRNNGRLLLESRDGGYTSALTVNEGVLTNGPSGVIDIAPGWGGPRILTAHLLNQGTVNVDYHATINQTNGVYENDGQFNIAKDITLTLNTADSVFRQNDGVLAINGTFAISQTTFNLNGGTLTNAGALDISDGAFNFNGGTATGNALYLVRCAVNIGANATSPIGLTLTGPTTFRAPAIQDGQTVWVQGCWRGNHTTVTAPTGFRNNGRLLLESRDGGYTSALTVNEGVLTNGLTGVIDIAPGWGGPRILTAHLLNQGTVNVDYHATFNQTNGVYENDGQFNIAKDITLTLNTADSVFRQNAGVLAIQGAFNLGQTTFNLNGGTLINAGGLDLSDGTFNFNGGTTTGNALYLVRCAVNIGPDATSPIGLTLTGPTTFRAPAIQDGQTVWVQGSWRGNHTTVSVPAGFINHGRLLLESRDGGYTSALTVTNGVLTNAQSGVIDVEPGAGGPRVLTADLLNQGDLNVNYGFSLDKAGGAFANEGRLTIAAGQTLNVAGSFAQLGGTTRLNGSVLQAGNPVEIQGGSLLGLGSVNAGLVNGGAVSPGLPVGILTVNGNYTQGLSGVLEIELSGLVAGTEYDQLNVSGKAQLAGKLRIILANGFQPVEGNSFAVLNGGSVTGNFTDFDLPPLAQGLSWKVTAGARSITLSVAANANAPLHISGTVTNTLGRPVSNVTVFAFRPDYLGLRGE